MSEQENMQATTKQRRSRKTNTANQQNGKQALAAQRPANEDTEAWKAYWKVQGQPWRTEPEIDEERQEYLAERRSIKPDIEQGIYPFKDIKLSRADIEWLLATHENGRGPVDWSNEKQRERDGLDLRGADVRQIDLRQLPLTRIRAGLTRFEWYQVPKEQRKGQDTIALILIEGADLSKAHLEGALLRKAELKNTILHSAHLEGADLGWSQLQGANLRGVHLEGADLWSAHLERADLNGAWLEKAQLAYINLVDEKGRGAQLADVHWGDANLAVVDWSQVKMLGDEYEARNKTIDEKKKEKRVRLDEYRRAVRANRQLAVALQGQGLNEEAARFTYRGQKLQRVVLRLQRKFGRYLFSLFLDLLTGYGYKPLRSFLAYLLVITAFATTYFIIGHTVGPALSPLGSFVFSMTSFHGRGFFPGGIALDDPLTVLAALEAFVGLLIEVTFIATLTQRLFSK